MLSFDQINEIFTFNTIENKIVYTLLNKKFNSLYRKFIVSIIKIQKYYKNNRPSTSMPSRTIRVSCSPTKVSKTNSPAKRPSTNSPTSRPDCDVLDCSRPVSTVASPVADTGGCSGLDCARPTNPTG